MMRDIDYEVQRAYDRYNDIKSLLNEAFDDLAKDAERAKNSCSIHSVFNVSCVENRIERIKELKMRLESANEMIIVLKYLQGLNEHA